MRILVTGHKGFIGQNMVERLSASGHEVVGYEWGDWEIPLDVDRVIHLGAISSTTYDDVRQLLIQNVYFTEDLVKRCVEKGIPIQIASSASVYGIDNNTFCETDVPAPRNYYAWSKLMMEGVLEKNWGIPIQVFRYFNVYGPKEDHKGLMASPYHQFTVQAKTTGVINLFEHSNRYSRDFIHVDKIIDYHCRFFDVPASGVWNLGMGEVKTFEEVAVGIAKEYNADIRYVPMPKKLKSSYQTYTCANMTKTKDTLKHDDA